MRFALIATSAVAAVLASTTAAHAQESEGSFTGIRVEGVAGWDNFSAGSRESDSKDGFMGGGAIGYDYDMNGVVLGAEAELTATSASATVNGVFVPSDIAHLSADADIYLGARLGYAFSPQFLGYVKAGWTNLGVTADYTPNVPGEPFRQDSTSTDGYRVGLGLEYRFAGGIYAKGEYRYSNYGSIRDFDIDTDRSQIVVGLGYRF